MDWHTTNLDKYRAEPQHLLPHYGMVATSALANALIERSEKEGIAINAIKLNLLMILTHGWHMAVHDIPLIREPVYAAKELPLINTIYWYITLKDLPADLRFNRMLLQSPLQDKSEPTGQTLPENEAFSAMNALIDTVWQTYGEDDEYQLLNMLNDKAAPCYLWKTYLNFQTQYHDPTNAPVIPNQLLRDWCLSLSKPEQPSASILKLKAKEN
ncbi:hypothetical protein [Pelagibaculum spongiae]|uniref:Uncharacterized protein n=1 Tax=Pelagibaculum spongiae TaxID=2080658 RepID=A0A2V1GYS5_9GAMM|nr:hypothetical protein [Pelagibaculum spongiae]PVZ71589.1 hypothetical protein DC094_00670 [Pelagibaculum spongiae]